MKTKGFLRYIAGALFAVCCGQALAGYPERPVTIIVPFAAGGGTDIVGRLLAERLGTLLKQTFIVDNKPGAGAALGASYVANAQPDGYTLLMGTSAELTIGPNLRKVSYDPVKSFSPIAVIGVSPNVILASPRFAARDIAGVISMAEANPEKITVGNGGQGTSPHLSGEMLNSMARIRTTQVPYRGTGPAMTDVIGGQIDLMVSTLAPALPMLKDNKVRALAVTSGKRAKQLPGVPTVAEQGLPGYEAVTWYALMAPAGIPTEAVERLRNAIQFLLHSKEVADRLDTLGIEPSEDLADPKAIRARIGTELAAWGRLIKTSGIQTN